MPRPLPRRSRVDAGRHQLLGILPDAGGQRVDVVRLVQIGDGAGGAVHQIHLGREGIAEEAGNPQGHIDARAVEHAGRHDLEPGDAAGRGVPGRPGAHQGQRLGDVVAAGPHVGGAPGRQRHGPGPVAVLLKVALDNARRRFPAQMPGGRRGNRARIDRIEVAPGRQNLRPSARRSAGGPGSTKRPSRPRRSPVSSASPQEDTTGRRCADDVIQNGAEADHSGSATTSPATSFRASSSSRSTVSPWVRQTPPVSSAAGRGPVQGSPMTQSSGSNSKPKIRRQSADQRGVPALALAARQPGQRHQKIGQQPPSGATPKTCRPSRIWSSFNSHR